jgi:hypothetical protein
MMLTCCNILMIISLSIVDQKLFWSRPPNICLVYGCLLKSLKAMFCSKATIDFFWVNVYLGNLNLVEI